MSLSLSVFENRNSSLTSFISSSFDPGRQTFSASVESFSAPLQMQTLAEHVRPSSSFPILLDASLPLHVTHHLLSPFSQMPSLLPIMLSLNPPSPSSSTSPLPEPTIPPQLEDILQQAWLFGRMLHASRPSSGSSANAFYRAFMPDLGSGLDPLQVSRVFLVFLLDWSPTSFSLVCLQIELVKRCLLSERGEYEVVGACLFPGLVKIGKDPQKGEEIQTVVRRAQVRFVSLPHSHFVPRLTRPSLLITTLLIFRSSAAVLSSPNPQPTLSSPLKLKHARTRRPRLAPLLLPLRHHLLLPFDLNLTLPPSLSPFLQFCLSRSSIDRQPLSRTRSREMETIRLEVRRSSSSDESLVLLQDLEEVPEGRVAVWW